MYPGGQPLPMKGTLPPLRAAISGTGEVPMKGILPARAG